MQWYWCAYLGQGHGRGQGRVRLQPLQAGTQLQPLSSDVDSIMPYSQRLPVSIIVTLV